MIEITAPEGFEVAENIEFRVTEDLTLEILENGTYVSVENSTVHMEDARTPENTNKNITFSKTEINGTEELVGATLKVINKADGSIVYEWISTSAAQVISLKAGEYEMIEITAPEGFEIAESIEFRITGDLKLEILENGNYVSVENSTVHMEDARTPVNTNKNVTFSKTEINGTEELVGATLKVINKADGSIVYEWISTSVAQVISLKAGEYEMIEITAPEGFEVAESITFRITEDLEVEILEGGSYVAVENSIIHMEDARLPEGTTTTETPTSVTTLNTVKISSESNETSPNLITSEGLVSHMNWIAPIALLLISIAGLFFLILKRKQDQN